jgi:hypothetical protein
MGDSWVLPTMYQQQQKEAPRKQPGSTHNYLVMAGNLHQIGYFFMGASFFDIINGS